MVLAPIVEADRPPEQYAYRPGCNALTAVRQVHRLLNTGHTQVVDADVSGYFDSIPHAELMKSVARRVVDRRMLPLIKMWLEAPVEETDKGGASNAQPITATVSGALRKALRFHPCWPICICAGSSWGGRDWA
jgi:retron-type reverse transcriptase